MNCWEESVYNLIPRPLVEAPRKPRYKSKFPGAINPKQFDLGPKVARLSATMGLPRATYNPVPNQFLRSHAKEPILPEPTAPSKMKEKRNPPVPGRDERPVMGLMSSKNFLSVNAMEAILSRPQKAIESQLWTQKESYGKIPKYLTAAKDKIKEEKLVVEDYLRKKDKEEAAPAHMTKMDEAEREDLLNYLKAKWDSVNTAYQKMTFTLDTPAKQKRKENYEKQLQEIERDIQMLDRGDYVLIVEE